MMGTTGLAWAAAALFAAVAAGLFVRLRQLAVDVNEAQIAAERLEGELRTARDERERESGKLRRKSDELADLRKRHEKLRKRKETSESKGGAPAAGGTNDRELEEARQARDRARENASALTTEIDALRAAHAEALADASAKTPDGAITPGEADTLRGEVESAHEAARVAKTEAESAEKQVARLKKRLEAQETAYVSLRGELEAKKDRLATQAEQLERLQALKVALVDSDAPSGSSSDEVS